MIDSVLMALALVAASGDSPAAAAATAFAPAPAQTSATGGASEDDRIICKRPPPVVGTRQRSPRICRTRAEWNEEARAAQDHWERRHRPASGDNNPD